MTVVVGIEANPYCDRCDCEILGNAIYAFNPLRVYHPQCTEPFQPHLEAAYEVEYEDEGVWAEATFNELVRGM